MTFKTGGATMMFCPDMPFEDAYLKALNKVEQYTVTDQELQLKGKDQLLIVYVPVDTTNASEWPRTITDVMQLQVIPGRK